MPSLRKMDAVDLGASCALALLAALAFLMPGGSALRFALVLPVLFFVPGHLLVTACTNAPRTAAQRGTRALAAVGVSPPLVGLLALSTAKMPGGFQASSIVAVVTAACFVLAAIAAWRRRVGEASPEAAEGEGVAA